MSFLYLAYGSNMLTARLQHRCPSARAIGTAVVSDHMLEFTKPSHDQSGKATLVSAGSRKLRTPGVVFEIEKTDLPKLDKAEGAGKGYDRHDAFKVQLAGTDNLVTVSTYLAAETRSHLRPFDWYLALVIAGAHEHGLDAWHIEILNRTDYQIDSHSNRIGRTEALKALAAHGYAEPGDLLRRR